MHRFFMGGMRWYSRFDLCTANSYTVIIVMMVHVRNVLVKRGYFMIAMGWYWFSQLVCEAKTHIPYTVIWYTYDMNVSEGLLHLMIAKGG